MVAVTDLLGGVLHMGNTKTACIIDTYAFLHVLIETTASQGVHTISDIYCLVSLSITEY